MKVFWLSMILIFVTFDEISGDTYHYRVLRVRTKIDNKMHFSDYFGA
jgi:hypothetical protein